MAEDFMDLLKEWLDLYEREKDLMRGLSNYGLDRMRELEEEINARMRGELPR